MTQTAQEMIIDRAKQYKSKSIESVNPDKNRIINYVEKNKDKALDHAKNKSVPKDKLDYNDGANGPSSD